MTDDATALVDETEADAVAPGPRSETRVCKVHGECEHRLYFHHTKADGERVYRARCHECHKSHQRRWTHKKRRELKKPERPARRVAPEELQDVVS